MNPQGKATVIKGAAHGICRGTSKITRIASTIYTMTESRALF